MHLMCQADVTPLTFWDADFRPMMMPDFGTLHTCRDFDAILEWAQNNPRALKNGVGNSTRFRPGKGAAGNGGHGQ